MRHVILGVVALSCLTAFAPAPLPRRGVRDSKDSLAVKDLIGNWRATALYQTGPQKMPSKGISDVRITQTQWIFNRSNATTYDLQIDHLKRPAEINLMYVGKSEPYGRGIIKREGNTLRIVYNWGSQRPAGFENQPGGYWDLTLVRE